MGRKSTFFYLSLWLFIQLLQAYFTKLSGDEAYYWYYSQKLACGYFDHPPAIAVLINWGYSIFPNELGVRLFPILLFTLGLGILEKIAKPHKPELFYHFISAVALMHFVGFMALPDAPMFFFACCTLFFLIRYEQHGHWYDAILLGLSAGLLLLSKYIGVLLLVFLLFTHRHLFRKVKFYWALFPFLACLLPHISWQWQNDFPSILYHLNERNKAPDVFSNLGNYIIIQPFMFMFLPAFIIWKSVITGSFTAPFHKQMLCLFIGIYLFFLVNTFRGRIESHWTFISIIPGSIIGLAYLKQKPNLEYLFRKFFPITIFLILATRVLLAVNTDKLPIKVKHPFYAYQQELAIVHNLAQGRPVLFMNSYQKASLYRFYYQEQALSLNNVNGRKNQYNLSREWADIDGGEVMLVMNYRNNASDSLTLDHKQMLYYKMLSPFYSYKHFWINAEVPEIIAAQKSELEIKMNLLCLEQLAIPHIPAENMIPSLYANVFKQDQIVAKELLIYNLPYDFEKLSGVYKIPLRLEKGEYSIIFAVQSGFLPGTFNSKFYRFRVE
jgi:hypothetical protein